MKRFLVGLLTVIFAVTLSGCFGDLVKSDLEDYIKTDQAVSAKYSDQFMNNFQRKASLAKTPEDFSKVVAELKDVLVDIQKQYGALKPKSDEVKPLVEKVNTSITLMIEAVDDLDKAVAEQDQNLMMGTLDKMNKATTDLNTAEAAIVKLANDKGIKIQQRK